MTRRRRGSWSSPNASRECDPLLNPYPPPPPRRRWPLLVAALVVLAVALGLLASLRYAGTPDDLDQARQAARRLANQVTALTPASLEQATLERLATSRLELEAALEPLDELVSEDPLVGLARIVPIVGEQIDAADALLDAGTALTEAADIGLGLADEVVTVREANLADRSVPLMPGLVELLATSGDEIDRLDALVASARASLDEIPDGALGPIVEARDLVAEPLAEYAPLLETLEAYDETIADLLGWEGQKRYLVLAQNPAELRPSGGYAGTIGVVGLADGQIVEQRFRDVHELSRQPGLPFLEAPKALTDYLLGEDQSWRLADAAWAVDFPTAAEEALRQYIIETGDDDIDGVIAITTYAIDRLLEVVGPVEVPQYDLTVQPGEATLTLLGATRGSPGSVEGRKEVLDVLARRLTNRLLSLQPGRWVAMNEALEDIGSERMTLLWMADDAAQALVDETGWDGRVSSEPRDTVYVVESNVSPTSKYNLVVDRADSLVVTIDETGDAVSSLRMDWDNRAGSQGEPYASLREFSNNEDGWYGSYVRVLVPAAAELVTASGQASESIRSPESITDEAGHTSFANYLFMPPGASSLTYLWTVPGAAQPSDEGWRYELLLRKQPGARPMDQSVVVDLPAGASVTGASPGAMVEGERVTFDAPLDADLELFVEYALSG